MLEFPEVMVQALSSLLSMHAYIFQVVDTRPVRSQLLFTVLMLFLICELHGFKVAEVQVEIHGRV
jgi:hypothetical protein